MILLHQIGVKIIVMHTDQNLSLCTPRVFGPYRGQWSNRQGVEIFYGNMDLLKPKKVSVQPGTSPVGKGPQSVEVQSYHWPRLDSSAHTPFRLYICVGRL